ncbi:hypothetical protein STEG23_008349, partial [Scotinomys teguina]
MLEDELIDFSKDQDDPDDSSDNGLLADEGYSSEIGQWHLKPTVCKRPHESPLLPKPNRRAVRQKPRLSGSEGSGSLPGPYPKFGKAYSKAPNGEK